MDCEANQLVVDDSELDLELAAVNEVELGFQPDYYQRLKSVSIACMQR